MGRLLLVRHGETAWNDEGRIQGWAPVRLSETGRQQAATLGNHIATEYDADAVVSSDLPRTVETADAVADALGLSVETDRRLRERHFGVYQGFPSENFFERFPEMDLLERGTDAAAFTPESGESWLTVRERVFEVIDDLSSREGTAVVSTHVSPIRLVLGRSKGLDIVASLTELPVGNCSLTVVEPEGDIVAENETGFLD